MAQALCTLLLSLHQDCFTLLDSSSTSLHVPPSPFRLAVIEGFLDTNTTPPAKAGSTAAAAAGAEDYPTTSQTHKEAQGLVQKSPNLLDQLYQVVYICTAVLHSEPKQWLQYKEELGGCWTIPFFLGGAAEEFLHQRYFATTAAAAASGGAAAGSNAGGGGGGAAAAASSSAGGRSLGAAQNTAAAVAAGGGGAGSSEITDFWEAGAAAAGEGKGGSGGSGKEVMEQQKLLAPAAAAGGASEGPTGAAGRGAIPQLVCRLALPKFTLKSLIWIWFGLIFVVRVRGYGMRGDFRRFFIVAAQVLAER